MGSRRGQAVYAAVVAAAAVGASAAWSAPLRVLIAGSPNKTKSNRTAKTISGIVIHDTEGRFVGSVRFLQRARARGSAHFVVSRRGQVVQLVPVTDVAWHSGNRWWNLHAIGIEHEGWVGRRAYTEREYRASAQLVAYLGHRWGVPLDRAHIVGHDEVPNPNHPGSFGGVSGHTDPGRFWNWVHYMGLVRFYAAHPVLPHFVHRMTLVDSPVPRRAGWAAEDIVTRPPRRARHRSVVDRGATLQGKALWWSGIDAGTRWRRHIWKVDFLVDGATLYTDHTWPFGFHRHDGWDTGTVANGRHMLTVLAYGAHHYRVRKHVPVRVSNPRIPLTVDGASSGAAVVGELTLRIGAGMRIAGVALTVDGTAVSRDRSKPYRLLWDTRTVAEGAHTLVVYGRAQSGRRSAVQVPVLVANAATFPRALTGSWTERGFADQSVVADRDSGGATGLGVPDPER
jgi:hypothetical protein